MTNELTERLRAHADAHEYIGDGRPIRLPGVRAGRDDTRHPIIGATHVLPRELIGLPAAGCPDLESAGNWEAAWAAVDP